MTSHLPQVLSESLNQSLRQTAQSDSVAGYLLRTVDTSSLNPFQYALNSRYTPATELQPPQLPPHYPAQYFHKTTHSRPAAPGNSGGSVQWPSTTQYDGDAYAHSQQAPEHVYQTYQSAPSSRIESSNGGHSQNGLDSRYDDLHTDLSSTPSSVLLPGGNPTTSLNQMAYLPQDPQGLTAVAAASSGGGENTAGCCAEFLGCLAESCCCC